MFPHLLFLDRRPTTINTMQIADNSFIKKLKSSGRSLVVFYGSQTGTAEEFAGRLAKEGMRYKLKGMVADPEECDMEELLNLKDIPNSLAVFCLATYGEGDPTDNCMEFYEWIKNGDADLTGLNFAVSIRDGALFMGKCTTCCNYQDIDGINNSNCQLPIFKLPGPRFRENNRT